MRQIIIITVMAVIFSAGAAKVFARIPPVEFYRLYSTQERSFRSTGGYYSPYSYNFVGTGKFDYDTIEIYAVRIEFKPDSLPNTTGNGLFMRRNIEEHEAATRKIAANIPLHRNARREFRWYHDGTYKYDRIPHDSVYFDDHLTSLRNYYSEVSNGNIKIGWRIFPDGDFGAFRLNREIVSYSPGLKRRDETFDEFNVRVGRGLMQFVSQAVTLAASADGAQNPFAELRQDNKGRIYKIGKSDEIIPVFILLIHAGVSALTDGGLGGAGNADSPSDLTDAFIGEELFKFFLLHDRKQTFDTIPVAKDEITGRTGMRLSGLDGQNITLSELMMVSSTANQDSLNWGINGILVNQFARQLGIPDLYSTSSGISGTGRFCIMDFAGYSAGQGFIPPNPSAFVRSFMGWDKPIHAAPPATAANSFHVRALLPQSNNTLFLIPINSTEYYLIENRQRNLTDSDLFAYDENNGRRYISSGFNVNLDNNVDAVSRRSSVVMSVKSRDIGLPASGVAVWHIDEKLVANRLKHNMLNSDSSYRAVHLVEADGITDIGVQFTDMLGFPWFDYGSSADVFPHTSIFRGRPEITSTMSPTTAPATTANDGGNTFLKLVFGNTFTRGRNKEERYYYARGQNQNSKFSEYEVVNISDTIIRMTVSLERENISPVAGFPVRVKGSGGFFPLLTADILRGNGSANDMVTLSKDGNLTILAANGDIIFTDSISAVNMPTMVGNSLFIPCKNKIMIYNGEAGVIRKDSVTDINVSSNIVGMGDDFWSAGTKSGEVIFGNGKAEERRIKFDDSEINAIAKFGENSVAVISENGRFAIVEKNEMFVETSAIQNVQRAFPPFKIAIFEDKIAIADRKNGLWILGEEWQDFPSDWAGIFRESMARRHIPDNHGYISAADLTGDGTLNILIGGTNGVYAFDEKGNLLANYPALLDRANWNIRKSVQATPLAAQTADGETKIFFTTTTGDNRSYYQTKVIESMTDIARGMVYFKDIAGNLDSIGGLSAGYIDTLMRFNDGIILPYFAPGGLIDIRHGRTGKRPDDLIRTENAGRIRVFPYLISIGSPLSQGVVLDDIDKNGVLDMIAVSDVLDTIADRKYGLLYRFELPNNRFPANQSNMVGGNAQRQFNFVSSGIRKPPVENLEYFYSYPNPVRIRRGENGSVTFRYELGDNAASAMLTIYTIQGQKVFEERNLPLTRGVNEYVLRDMSRFGSAVYRARLSVRFGSNEKVLFWKMAVLR